MIPSILVDARNFDHLLPRIVAEVAAADFVGLDCETQDDGRHEGLNQFCGYNPKTRKKPPTNPLVFDMRRTVMTGFSIWPENAPQAYYVNLNHADVENRVPWDKARAILDARRPSGNFICHNLAFELTVFKSCFDYDLLPAICTLQMAVSAYNPDQYDHDAWVAVGQGGIAKLIKPLLAASRGFDPFGEMSPELSELVFKVIGKTSNAEWSYNGFVKSIAYGYGLKKAVKSFFGYQMTTFEEALVGKAHMGELTGEEVAAYGADDAYWAVRLFRHLLVFMTRNCPEAISAFFEQENPMVPVFSEIWRRGMRVNSEAIAEYRDTERQNMAGVLRELKTTIRQLLPFDELPHARLKEIEPWYAKNHIKYRHLITEWATTPDQDDDYQECMLVRGPVSNSWAGEQGDGESRGPNLSHYMPVRVLMYDLLREKPIMSDGKVQSDGEARGKLKTRLEKNGHALGVQLIDGLNRIAGVEQRMKLYLTPYTLLTDPETNRLYPVVSSELATRRMASSHPNPMALAKRGEGAFVRGFFLGDTDEHVLVSIDWSAIELVDIGEASGDPEFLKAFGQLPHQDMHSGAAADILTVEVPELTEEIFKSLKFATEWPQLENVKRLQTDLKGQSLPLEKAMGYWRTEIGKGANFNYWYSGFLGTVGERMGWNVEKTGKATERYRERFAVAEAWRRGVIGAVAKNGYVQLPDGHRRVRYEATDEWLIEFLAKFEIKGVDDYNNVIRWIANKIQKRAHNQAVNARIQGNCATLAKRSARRIVDEIKNMGLDARFMIPIHDELVASVHRSQVAPYIRMAHRIMTDHPDLYKLCKLDASPSVGLTFEPWNAKKAPFGQVELNELPAIGIGTPGKKVADDGEIEAVVEYLYDRKRAA